MFYIFIAGFVFNVVGVCRMNFFLKLAMFISLVVVVGHQIASSLGNVFNFHLSNSWYPGDKKKLLEKLEELDSSAVEKFDASIRDDIRAVIVPHAGYAYSGEVAMSVYRHLKIGAYDRVVLLAPSHHVDFGSVALPDFKYYRTPLGSVQIDSLVVDSLAKNSFYKVFAKPYRVEHSLEIQLPILQRQLKKIKLVPLIVGNLSNKQVQEVARILKSYIDSKTLVIATSDFTHYGNRFDYVPFTENIAQQIVDLDSSVLEKIYSGSYSSFLSFVKEKGATICGKYPIAVLLSLIDQDTFGSVEPYLIAYDTSAKQDADSTGSVSYVGLAYGKPSQDKQFNQYEKSELLKYVRDTLKGYFTGIAAERPVLSPNMLNKSGAFVTLYNRKKSPSEQLRGCLGMITPGSLRLYQVVADRSLALARGDDTRFSKITLDEVKDLDIEISVLTDPVEIKSYNEIVLGKHGNVLTKGRDRAVYLPKVPIEQKWDLPAALSSLSQKAGLEANAWKSPGVKFEVFETIDFSDLDI